MTEDDLFQPPAATKHNFLSLGAGVQSSVLALMAARGEIGPMPDAAIFADTEAEPAGVYVWLDWLEKQLPFPLLRVSAGSLTETSLKVRTSGKTGETYLSHNVPSYTINSNGSLGNFRRQCTDKHKLAPLTKLCDKLRKKEEATVWIGISWDEAGRMRDSQRKGVQHRWPLIERRMTRRHCLDWMTAKGYPKPPRSACVYCPYHSNAEWRRLKTEDPESFQIAIDYEKRLQETAASIPRLDGKPFLHPSRVPLAEVELDEDANQMQFWNTMQNECLGMCGV